MSLINSSLFLNVSGKFLQNSGKPSAVGHVNFLYLDSTSARYMQIHDVSDSAREATAAAFVFFGAPSTFLSFASERQSKPGG